MAFVLLLVDSLHSEFNPSVERGSCGSGEEILSAVI
jgi:hypothetical protein